MTQHQAYGSYKGSLRSRNKPKEVRVGWRLDRLHERVNARTLRDPNLPKCFVLVTYKTPKNLIFDPFFLFHSLSLIPLDRNEKHSLCSSAPPYSIALNPETGGLLLSAPPLKPKNSPNRHHQTPFSSFPQKSKYFCLKPFQTSRIQVKTK